MIDCSHGNSGKDPARQPLVFSDVIHQIVEGNRSIIGAMIESNLEWGNQPLAERSKLRYGVSITDACIDWPTTERPCARRGEAAQSAQGVERLNASIKALRCE